ncbi:MAG TPA: ADOP family duplicated permease [Xanthomonadaceae bacterium]|nr:ADOP family duplicated permease [Xanthomonadaceae bacterium]
MTSELRHAFRQLTLRPLVTAVAVITLALGIGATTAMFSTLKPVLIEALPHADAARLRVLAPYPWVHAELVSDVVEAAGADAALAGYYPKTYALMAGQRPLEVQGADVTSNFFHLLGMPLVAGRAFADADEGAVTVIGMQLAQRLYGDATSALGSDLQINAQAHRIIGVVEADWPLPQLDMAGLWLPLDRRPTSAEGAPNWMIPILRLKNSGSSQAMQAQLDAVLARYLASGAELPRSDYRWQDLREALVGDQGRQLVLLQLAVVLVLVLACANVASLQMARMSERVAEIGVRRALGASRARLLRQVLLESLLLSLLAAALAAVLLVLGMGALAAIMPTDLLRFGAPTLDAGSTLFAFAVASVAGLASAIGPALWTSRVGAERALSDNARSVAGTRGGRRSGALLVSAEIAMTLLLLVGAGLLLRSFQILSSEPPGFRSDNVLVMPLRMPETQHDSVPTLDAAWQRMLDSVAGVPGVASVALSNRVPLARGGTTRLFMLEGETEPRLAQHGIVSPGYLETLGIPRLRGRFIDTHDRRGTENVTVIDAALWQQLWPDQDPIGKRFRLLMGGDDHWLTVVGVAGDIRGSGLAAAPAPGFYIPYTQRPEGSSSLAVGRNAVILVRAAAARDTLPEALREAVWAAEPQLPVPEIVGLDTVLHDSLAPQRFRARVVGAFAVLALLLSIAGVYGVVSQVVARRVHEFGIRKAMGATARDLRAVVIRWALLATAAGTLLGLLGVFALAQALAAFLHGVTPADPVVALGAVGLLLIAVLGAALGPAQRAARIDPMQALREQ